jgi:hypothetical protein
MWIDEMNDKVLRAPDGELYGPLRPTGEVPEELAGRAFASDCCGNYFLLEEFGSVTFWDHETGEFIELANTWQDFVDWLIIPDRVEVRPGQVKRAWIDPEFSAKHDGTKKYNKSQPMPESKTTRSSRSLESELLEMKLRNFHRWMLGVLGGAALLWVAFGYLFNRTMALKYYPQLWTGFSLYDSLITALASYFILTAVSGRWALWLGR